MNDVQLTDQAMRTLRRIVLAKQWATGVHGGEKYYRRLLRLNYRAFLRWKRREARAPGYIRPTTAGYQALAPMEQREIETRVRAALARARGA
jgi:hypothetical protein